MKTKINLEDPLWDLWNSPDSAGLSPDDGSRLDELHRKMSLDRESTRNRTMIAAGFSLSAALALICIVLSLRIYRDSQFQDSLHPSVFTVSAGVDGPSSMTLPDGSTVMLNARSTLSYDADFGQNERIVTLVGEGFFDVAKDPERKFIVRTQNMKISVHGTRFNVYAYPERNIDEISLVEGSVSVSAGGNELTMEPGEKVVYDKSSGSTHLTRTDNGKETAWLGQEISFTHATLADVFDTLERRFGVSIVFNGDIDMNDRYTGSFTDRRIGDIIEILQMHYHFDYDISDNIIRLTKTEKP